MYAVKQFFLSLYEAMHAMQTYKAQKYVEKHSRDKLC